MNYKTKMTRDFPAAFSYLAFRSRVQCAYTWCGRSLFISTVKQHCSSVKSVLWIYSDVQSIMDLGHSIYPVGLTMTHF